MRVDAPGPSSLCDPGQDGALRGADDTYHTGGGEEGAGLTNSHRLQRPQSNVQSNLCEAPSACPEAPLTPVPPTCPPQAHRGPASSPLPPAPRSMAASEQPLLHKLPRATSPSKLTPPLPRAKCPDPSQASPPQHPHLRKTPGSPGPMWRWAESEGLGKASGEGRGRPHFLQGQSLHTSPSGLPAFLFSVFPNPV